MVGRQLIACACAALVLAGCGGRSVSVAAAPPVGPGQIVYAFQDGKGGELIGPSFDAVEGNKFQVAGSNVIVKALGYEYEAALRQPGPTAIFDASGNVLASTTLSASDNLARGYYWQTIKPITLKAAGTYYIGSLHGTGAASEYIWNTQTAQTPSFITDQGTYFKISSTIEGGSWQYGGGVSQYGPGEIRHYVGNFMAQPVPAL